MARSDQVISLPYSARSMSQEEMQSSFFYTHKVREMYLPRLACLYAESIERTKTLAYNSTKISWEADRSECGEVSGIRGKPRQDCFSPSAF